MSIYKPSPLSFGSPRTSPFRRPESPASPLRRPESPSSPSTTLRPTTPTPITSPTKVQQNSPSKLQKAPMLDADHSEWAHCGVFPSTIARGPSTSPSRDLSVATATPLNRPDVIGHQRLNGDALSKLPPSQVREMREAFQILDRDNDGLVNRDDVIDMLTNLGQPSSSSDVTAFFPLGAQQTLSLPAFLSTLSSLLAPFSNQTELLNAFAAFDDHDSGEIDVGELKDAVLNTALDAEERSLSNREIEEVLSGFVGRRAFGKDLAKGGGGRRGEVFKYREWVSGVMGTGKEKKESST